MISWPRGLDGGYLGLLFGALPGFDALVLAAMFSTFSVRFFDAFCWNTPARLRKRSFRASSKLEFSMRSKEMHGAPHIS